MALILNIDTATEVCSVALARDGRLVAVKENGEGLNHSTLLGVYVDEVLREARLSAADLDAVAVSMGPGSYTGLRIGVSLAKGLCFGAGKPLIAVGTLNALAHAAIERTGLEALYCPMIDARRMEVYTAVFDRQERLTRISRRLSWTSVLSRTFWRRDRFAFSATGATKSGACCLIRTPAS